MIEKYPWLLPLIWLLREGGVCDPVIVSRELGVPLRLARSLVYYGRRLGYCDSTPDLCVVRRGSVFYGVRGSLVVVAVLRNRRVSAYTFKLGFPYSGGKKKRYVEALEALRDSCLLGEELGPEDVL